MARPYPDPVTRVEIDSMNRIAELAIVSVAIFAIACGGGSSSPTAPTAPSTPPTSTAYAPPPPAGLTIALAEINHARAIHTSDGLTIYRC